jgi:hypothetical protein
MAQVKHEVTFDGILFDSEADLINFLKHSYFANKSSEKTLRADLDKLSKKVKRLSFAITTGAYNPKKDGE